MAWRTNKVEEQRKEFINAVLSGNFAVTELCREFQISRKTAYKWIHRFDKEGVEGLKNQSKAPHKQAGRTDESVIKIILDLKNKYPKWGPKKILGYLELHQHSEEWPSTTTIGKILDKNGLVIPRKYRRRFPAKTDPLSHCEGPNDIWCIDFKGWFKTKDNIKCDPLTLTDAYSRFLLHCSKIPCNSADYVWEILDRTFYEYGLPIYLRHDNGPPFATNGAGRLSRLSVKLIKAGVIPEWIEPGKPYQNSRHERMHLTLKEEGANPLELTLKEQQLKFSAFQKYFNFERPHEALQQQTPGSIYKPSNRVWAGKFRSPEYTQECKIKRIRDSGQLSWYGTEIFIGKTLKNEDVAVKENEDGEWSVYFGPVFLGVITQEKEFIQLHRSIRKKTKYKTQNY